MSVQAAVAFLNKSNTNVCPKPVIIPSKLNTWKSPTEKDNTTTRPSDELKRTKPASGGVATILSKFGQQPQPLTATNDRALPNKSLSSKPLSTSSTPTVTPSPPTVTPSSPPTKSLSPTPTKTPLSTPTKQPSSTAPINRNIRNQSNIDFLCNELTLIYQEALDRADAADERIKKLEADLELASSDSTKVRDYEIRLEYLTQAVEQMSAERELYMSRQDHGKLDTPVSPICHPLPIVPQEEKHDPEPEESRSENENEEILNGILDAYKDREEDYADSAKYQEEISILNEQLAAYDQGMKTAMETYVKQLEMQRLETKNLMNVVNKQEELIGKLEKKLNNPVLAAKAHAQLHLVKTDLIRGEKGRRSIQRISTSAGNEELLREQVELQRIELEDKRELLTQLLNERENLLHVVQVDNTKPKMNRSSARSSIDFLAELTKSDLHLASSSPTRSYSGRTPRSSYGSQCRGRSTPPPSAPPRDPLPPVPAPSSKSSIRGSFSSSRGSLASSTTSWSSTDYDRHVVPIQPSRLSDKEMVYAKIEPMAGPDQAIQQQRFIDTNTPSKTIRDKRLLLTPLEIIILCPLHL
ncbi:hypothetical protein DFQ28_010196 [Apophysomyces sp. BC1034]|nr:hypothetical protein DFQ30_009780 [Apophysomyces sp. BC1015]KAG0171854.1 hypothetical protein DFQ29_008650 [Apophysomyces sp. BC1021]KAG0184956.1 hypothetical protein DFQ28_010196 [Apophysomyces sp. BC1034]